MFDRRLKKKQSAAVEEEKKRTTLQLAPLLESPCSVAEHREKALTESCVRCASQ